MRRKLVLLISLLLMISIVSAQTKKGFIAHSDFSTGLTLNTDKDNYTPVATQIAVGYAFNHTFSLSFAMDGTAELLKINNIKDHYLTTGFGLQLGVVLSRKDAPSVLEAYTTVGSTIGGDFTYFYTDAGIRWMDNVAGAWAPYIFGAIRYQKSYTSKFDNYTTLRFGLGFKFGH